MAELFAQIIPLCIGAAIDPVLLALTLTLLSSKNHPKAKAFSFLFGSVLVMALIAYLGILLGEGIIGGGDRHILKATIDIIFGVLLFYLGISSIIEKNKEKNTEKDIKKEENEVRGKGLLKWLVVGFIVNITNVDALVLYFTACKEIGHADFSAFDKIIFSIISGTIVLFPIILPLFFSIIIPKTAEKILKPVGKFMDKYGSYIVAVIFIAFAIIMLIKGLKILL